MELSEHYKTSTAELLEVQEAVAAMRHRVAELEQSKADLRSLNESLLKRIELLEANVRTYRDSATIAATNADESYRENATLTQDAAELAREAAEADAENDLLASERDSLQEQVFNLEAKNIQLQTENAQLRERLLAQESTVTPEFRASLQSLRAELGLSPNLPAV